MELNIIVAIAANGVIGCDNKLLWHLPADLKLFKQTTMGCPIIMGRKTFESIGRILPGRVNMVVSRNLELQIEGCLVFHSIEAAIEAAQKYEKVFVIGGGEIYRQAMNLADHLFVSKVNVEFDGDTYFPEIETSKWKLLSSERFFSDEKNKYDFDFMIYSRVF